MRKWDEKVIWFHKKSLYIPKGLSDDSEEVVANFRAEKKENKLDQCLISKHFLFIDHLGQSAQLIMYKAKQRNIEKLISQRNEEVILDLI